ncbi:MAG: hypothetical protein H6742_18655 [Alphaproteobacteria bacterium]|nr:hypothetical protein [Alphaproteobacteria bacterium]
MTVELPAALRPWAPWLKGLDPVIADALGPALRQLDLAIGPLVSRAEPGGAEPDGVDGLTRRGSYDRLLLSEWVLADVLPDEFLRRAAQREHLFLDLARRTPQGGHRCLLILDGSPDVLGDARLVQLALLIVLARRAEAAAAEFRWGIFHRAAGSTFEGLSRRQLPTWQTGRSLAHPTAAHLAAWRTALDATPLPPGDELWLVGGATLSSLRAPDAWRVDLRPDDDLDGDAVAVRIHAPGGSPRALRLVLPETETRVRILRRPLEAAPPPRPPERETSPTAWVCPIVDCLRFSDSGHRLMGRLADGRVGAWKVPRSAQDRGARPWTSTHLDGDRVVAFGWYHQRLLCLTRYGRNGELQLRRQNDLWRRIGDIDDPPDPPADALPGRLFMDSRVEEAQQLSVLEPDGTLWIGSAEQPRLAVHPTLEQSQVLYIGHREGHLLRVWNHFGEVHATVGQPGKAGYQHGTVLSDRAEIAVGPTGPPWNLGLVMVRVDAQRWVLLQPHPSPSGGPFEIIVPPDERVLGATRRVDQRPVLLCLEPQTASLRLRGPEGISVALPHQGAVTDAATSPGKGCELAWRTDDGCISIYSMHNHAVTARFFPTKDAWEADRETHGQAP